jgi:hypothetical protein
MLYCNRQPFFVGQQQQFDWPVAVVVDLPFLGLNIATPSPASKKGFMLSFVKYLVLPI